MVAYLPTKGAIANFERVKALAAAFPEVEVSTSYGTPALTVRGKLMARLKEDGVTLVLRAQWEERERLLALYPKVFFFTEHYRAHPWVLVHLAAVKPAQLTASLAHAYRQSAPKSLLKAVSHSNEGAS